MAILRYVPVREHFSGLLQNLCVRRRADEVGALYGFVDESACGVEEELLEAAPSNMLFGFGLFALFLLLFAGTVGVGLVYLALD